MSLYESSCWSSISILCDSENNYNFSANQHDTENLIQTSKINEDALQNPSITKTDQNTKGLLNKSKITNNSRKPKISGLAFGIYSTIQNIGLFVYPFIYGWINEIPSEKSYNNSTLLLLCKSSIGFIV